MSDLHDLSSIHKTFSETKNHINPSSLWLVWSIFCRKGLKCKAWRDWDYVCNINEVLSLILDSLNFFLYQWKNYVCQGFWSMIFEANSKMLPTFRVLKSSINVLIPTHDNPLEHLDWTWGSLLIVSCGMALFKSWLAINLPR